MKRGLRRVLPLVIVFVIVFTLFPMGTSVSSAANSKNFVVYFPNWGMYNATHMSMNVGMIPWNKVTCINHAFFTVDSSYKLATTDEYADFQATFEHSEGWNPGMLRGHFGEYKYYKTQYPNVKVVISVGGWTRGENFHAMAQTSSSRAIFIQSVIDFLKKYPFIDGIDLDWEYPGVNRAKDPNDEFDRGCPGGPEDKQNFTALLREIREAYNKNGMSEKLLTIAAPGGYEKVDLTEPDKYSQYLDWLNIMTYDIHGAWETVTNHQSAIYKNPNDPSGTTPVDIKNKYNTDYIMKYYRDTYNVPASKLNVGSPFYSRGWKNVVANTGTNGLFATASGAPVGNLDNPSSPGGQNSYAQMKVLENTAGYTKYRDSVSQVPWLYNSSLGIMYTYEDETSAAARCDYVIDNGFGGIIGWEISCDTSDFSLTNTISGKLGINGTATVITPVFSPGGGTYSSAQNVSISCATAGATIRYTIDGSEPTSSSNVYTGAIKVSSTTTVKAKAFKSGMNDSATVSAAYIINNGTSRVATPIFSPAGGTYTSAQNVSISCATAGATIRYTTDGSTPTSSSAQYTGAISVTSTKTIKVIAMAPGMNNSAVAAATYTISSSDYPAWAPYVSYSVGAIVSYNGSNYRCRQAHTSLTGWEPSNVPALWEQGGSAALQVATPSFSLAGGTYTAAQKVSISCATDGATIRYTTDGSTPTASSLQYTGAISVMSSITIKAIAMAAGKNNSNIASATYTISTTPPPAGTGSKLLVGYWHNFDNGLTPVMTLRNVSTKWDVIHVAFADIAGDGTVSFTPFNATDASFSSDVAYLKGLGKRVVLSLGGQNGALSLPDSAAKTRFINSLIATIDKYGFSGVDIDIETGIYLNGGDTDFRNPTTPTIVNLIAAMEAITERYDSSFTLSMAPEIAYVQGGVTAYGGPWGAYLPIIYGLQDKLTYIHVQHYNCGGNTALDGKTYNQGTADFEVAMAEMLLKGFPIANNAGNMFPALRQDQILIGLPAAAGAAPSGGYINPTEMKKALDYLMKGIPYGGTYQLQNTSGYSGFKGLMSWSVNWDAQNNYEFTNNYRGYFDALN
ncbi:hypothetical protein acsn021_30650 [Anaerocolumna cellulosilytica]|uniref:chitinase n=1 Tax=Anaerocolumna cellulosilytica TaxID=433286 RepID=A0A6S6R0C3_9FIRM|nr:glycosyl hydrolase family 18 protein [Anaerocolumna cellulosilytica]MBB5197477.1 GH18 family chitinase [Anaerocolumna cellulosilytica]BCJ95496.1 hypothetical protein acsn021_30650 [Anaerocolumna cellulosilytica]